tara:strand:+ start:484 stop:921 length:438 start_codon:yes stop_codon:yes gene_type:complete
MWAYLSWPHISGTDVVLATRPVDPFDPFRGQYMIINYEIANVERPEGLTNGDHVYIGLQPDAEGIARATTVSTTVPDGLFIRGTLEGRSLRFGIEQFFFEHHADVPTRDITVHAKIAASGRAGIVGLLKEGKPVEIEYKAVTLTS